MIRTISFIFILILSSSFDNADKIIGIYWSPDKDGKISIYKKGVLYYGRSIASNTPELKDSKNPDPKLRSRVVLGEDVFFDFVYDKDDNEYINGTIYNPLDGNTYSAKMWLDGDNLKLRGFIGFTLFGVTKTMERLK